MGGGQVQRELRCARSATRAVARPIPWHERGRTAFGCGVRQDGRVEQGLARPTESGSMKTRTSMTISALLAASVGLTACSSQVEGQPQKSSSSGATTSTTGTSVQPSRALPPRTKDVDLTGLNPCKALTGDQEHQLDYDMGYETPPKPDTSDVYHGPDCTFNSSERKLGSTVGYSTSEGANVWLNDPSRTATNNVQIAFVDEFPAIEVTFEHPRASFGDCSVVVDTHDGRVHQCLRLFGISAVRPAQVLHGGEQGGEHGRPELEQLGHSGEL